MTLAIKTLLELSRSLSHMRDCMAVGTLTVPMWKSAQFWPLLCNDGVHLNLFVREWLFLPRRSDLFLKGRAKNTFISLVIKRSSSVVLSFGLTSLNISVVSLWGSARLPSVIVRSANLERLVQVCVFCAWSLSATMVNCFINLLYCIVLPA